MYFIFERIAHLLVGDAQFVAQCQTALDVVQRDLDETGYADFWMRASQPAGRPLAEVFAVLPDSSYWTGSSGMTRWMNEVGRLVMAAAGVSQTLEEVHDIRWPVCAVHGGGPLAVWDRPAGGAIHCGVPVALTVENAGQDASQVGAWCGGAPTGGMRSRRWANSRQSSPGRGRHFRCRQGLCNRVSCGALSAVATGGRTAGRRARRPPTSFPADGRCRCAQP